MSKTLVQEQFGKTAASYLTSKPHALGKSLERMVALTAPQKSWRALDVATGGGHVAYTFAPHVERIWASDITQEMLDMVKAEAQKRGLANLRTTYAKAEALPFEDANFDLVTCRIAPHHFESIPAFLGEVHRVLKPGGLLALVDNVVPAGSVGDYINAFERFRDPSHLRAWTMEEWRDALKAHSQCHARRADRQDHGIQRLGRPPRRHHAGAAALDADADDAGGERGARAERGGRRHHLPALRGPVHRQARLAAKQNRRRVGAGGFKFGGLRGARYYLLISSALGGGGGARALCGWTPASHSGCAS